MKTFLTTVLLFCLTLSTIGVSVTQHFCTMAEKQTETAACEMCTSEQAESSTEPGRCCTNLAIHHHLDEDYTVGFAVNITPLPIETEAPVSLSFDLVDQEDVSITSQLALRRSSQPTFLATLEHTVLRV